ncbi:hypothetical protein XELAEV_18040967mg [Xenopus laevis]|uniref:GIY-YIG domain-containing protein n=1 Tax=Xenopus laevis TaxID=8355 RepID=A0A974CAF0_XENLA|nr:hypothetical protein XELAEV_18040967mg [Xenopus laevis]
MAPQYTHLFMAQLEENVVASCNTRPLTYLQFNQFPHYQLLGYNMYITMEPYRHPYTRKQQAALQALRYNRICSNLDERNKHLHSFWKSFVNQGSHPQVIDDQIHRATQIPRDTLLDYKEKTENNRTTTQSEGNDCHKSLPKTTKSATFLCNSNRCETANPSRAKIKIFMAFVYYMIICTGGSTGGRYIGDTGQKLYTKMNHHRHKTNTNHVKHQWGNTFAVKITVFGTFLNTISQVLHLGSDFM